MAATPPAPGPARQLAEEDQRETTRLCVETALLLMQHGTESAVVENMVRRLGLSLGVERVEAGIFANSVVLTTLSERRSMTTVRRSEDRGINMHLVTEVQRAVLSVEAGELDGAGYRTRLEGLFPFHYPRWLVSLAIGLSCACFARLAGADWAGCGVVVLASSAAMGLRQGVARLRFSPLVAFFAAAFVATSIAGLSELMGVGETPRIAAASSVLLLVPGFPLINGVSDVVKGHWSTGVARLVFATLLSAATCTGILLAISLWQLWGLL
ncbi:MAG TPA: threonine/serine exporter ThrE family protein [Anaeromyxobacter sp.]|nr:threonine/serine exporter ThrE family protein [Anaeromyxobacter sp.]